ncbi:hypothetical membrane protein [Corynebacterium renale]|uniref:hypothetical protein n=2 Tax=Corynebacterium renale TaxID=1724 RepID=UPI000DA402E8|nr:hypothetical protein [Corynebacterium renale]SQG63319.1 hypothetical membrane protein [Corynebacterium renale]STC99519.1 hypothetical membrane protein [Corynebacterium renale]
MITEMMAATGSTHTQPAGAASRPARSGWNSVWEVPAHYVKTTWSFIRTTPGTMLTMVLLLCAAIFAAGYSMSVSTASRHTALSELLQTTEPTSYAAHNLYTSLSLADTIATSSLVQVGPASPEQHREYTSAILQASTAASQVASGVGSGDQRATELIAAIQRDLPMYTGIVETARANHRSANPVAVAYLTQASAMMREDIFPAAEELFDRTSHSVSANQSRLAKPQWVPLSGLVAAFGFLVVAQWWLWRRTRRRFNAGFGVATVCMVVALGWVGASNFFAWQAVSRGYELAASPWEALTDARIAAQQARTTETLALVRRDTLAEAEASFRNTTRQVTHALDDYEAATTKVHDDVVAAREATVAWEDAHTELVGALARGDFQEATRLTTQHGDTAASAFRDLDGALAQLIDDSRTTRRAFVGEGVAATTFLSISVLLLSVAAIVAVIVGIRPRLQEYL